MTDSTTEAMQQQVSPTTHPATADRRPKNRDRDRHASNRQSRTGAYTLSPKYLVFRSFALACAIGAAACVVRYPLGPVLPAVCLVAYAILLAFRPHWWVVLLPAALPVLNLYPWTGWLFIEEFDLAVLATLAMGYWRASPKRTLARLTPPGKVAIALLAISYMVSALLPLNAVGQVHWEMLATYNTPLNSLRILKGFAWAFLLLPLLLRATDAHAGAIWGMLLKGMIGGLGLASLVVVWERNAFPGLMNFSSDYRAIGSFFEAHVGGAALDGYLALSLPFVAALLIRARNLLSLAAAGAFLLLGLYATFATFSRGLYAGVAVEAGLIGGLVLFQLRKARSGDGFAIAAILTALVVCSFLFFQVFASGGYRTLAAVLGAYAGAFYVGGTREEPHWRGAIGLSAVLSIVTIIFVIFVFKGAYVVYALSILSGGLLACLERLGHLRRRELVLAACAWVGINAVAVGWHWGGGIAAQDAAMAVVVAACLALYSRTTAKPLWSLSWQAAAMAIAASFPLAVAIPVAGNYYMKSRMQTVGHDLEMREDHWQDTVDMQGNGWASRLFGAGLGRYPESYFWSDRRGDSPGAVLFLEEERRNVVRLIAPRADAGYGVDPLQLSQRIGVKPGERLTLEVLARALSPKTSITIDACEKWLLYVERCTGHPVRFKLAKDEWKHYSSPFDTGDLGKSEWWGSRPALLSIAVDGRGSVVDLDDIRLTTASGVNLLSNGNFLDGGDRWYFTSDRNHLPWHAKNLLLGIWFDQGWFGALAFVALCAVVLVRALAAAAAGSIFHTALAAAAAGLLVVGVFDTLFDSSRLATAFYLLCMAGFVELGRGWPRSSRPGRPVR